MTSSAGEAAGAATRALAVFHDRGAPEWGRLLAPGFRHCFAAVLTRGTWIVADARGGALHLSAVARGDYDLAGFYRRHGFRVVAVTPPAGGAGTRRHPPLAAASCVGATKWLLGVHAPFVFTPRQLYRHLLTRPPVHPCQRSH
ncbi:MAG: hypothetical protein AB7N54_13145 [Alphaproteobacteria bacterium]